MTKSSLPLKFEIRIQDTYFGRLNNEVIVSNETLSFQGKIYRKNGTALHRRLKKKESERLEQWTRKTKVETLQDKYSNPQVKDGTHIKFHIMIGDQIKTIVVDNVYQGDLGELIKIINTLFPEDVIYYRDRR